MLANVDPIGKIQQLYEEKRPVSYLAFMQVFNDLLEDPASLVVRDPRPELREKFRAACMAVAVGVIDTEGRAEERVREFREKIYPIWESKLPAQEFERYRRILGVLAGARHSAQAESGLLRNPPARPSALLKKLRLVESGTPQPTAAPVSDGYGVAIRTSGEARRFDTVDGVCKAILNEELTPEFLPRTVRNELAAYRMSGVDVVLSLARNEEKKYTVLTADIGHANDPAIEERLDDIGAQMGYVRQGRYAYARWDDECIYTLKVGLGKTSVAVSAAKVGAVENVVRHIQKAHMDLGEFLERVRSKA